MRKIDSLLFNNKTYKIPEWLDVEIKRASLMAYSEDRKVRFWNVYVFPYVYGALRWIRDNEWLFDMILTWSVSIAVAIWLFSKVKLK